MSFKGRRKWSLIKFVILLFVDFGQISVFSDKSLTQSAKKTSICLLIFRDIPWILIYT